MSGTKHGALEDHVLEDHLVGELALNQHMCSVLLQPGFRQRDHRGVYSFASEFLQ